MSPLPDQELTATVTGVVVLFHANAENTPSGAIGGGEFGNFAGIQAISINSGINTTSQAATSLSVHAASAQSARQTGRFAF